MKAPELQGLAEGSVVGVQALMVMGTFGFVESLPTLPVREAQLPLESALIRVPGGSARGQVALAG